MVYVYDYDATKYKTANCEYYLKWPDLNMFRTFYKRPRARREGIKDESAGIADAGRMNDETLAWVM